MRNALFTAAKLKTDKEHFGNGVLQAHAALGVKPVLGLKKSDPSENSWAFLRLLTGLGVVEIPPREAMFNLELAQRWLVNEELQAIVRDPDATTQLDRPTLRRSWSPSSRTPGPRSHCGSTWRRAIRSRG